MTVSAGASAPVSVFNREGRAPILVVCDHASNQVPGEFDNLGLSAASRHEHIAFDLGAQPLSQLLSLRLNAPLIEAEWSRLVVDLNRYPDDATLIPSVSDGTAGPGNANVDARERDRRLARFFTPYHATITRTLDAMVAAHRTPCLLLVHTFTPVLNGHARPWHLGLLYAEDNSAAVRLADTVIDAFGPEPGFVIGRNDPYPADNPKGYTMYEHAVARQLPYLCIEVRQDLLADAAGVAQWADRLAPVFNTALNAAVSDTRGSAT